MGFADRCHLKIPFPAWAKDNKDDPSRDFENWKEVQRWADDFYRICLPASGGKLPFYVAASDASDESKALSNYVCDGTNDEVQIQAAVDDMFALQATASVSPYPSGTVWLSEGTFSLGAAVDFDGTTGTPGVDQKSKIRGMGHFNTKLFGTTGTPHNCFALNNGGQWSVEDMAFFDFSTVLAFSDTGEGSAVVRCWFEDCSTGVVFFEQTNGSVVDCWFFDLTRPIDASYCHRLRISGNHFHSSSGVDILGYEWTTTTINNNVSYESDFFCTVEGYMRDVAITDNVVTQQAVATGNGGIEIYGGFDDGSTVVTGIVIADNVLEIHDQAIIIDGPHIATDTPPVKISDNQIIGSAKVDVRCMVTGNFISNGLTLNNPCDKALVANNWLGDSGVHGSAAATLTDNTTGAIVDTGAGNYLDGTWTP